MELSWKQFKTLNHIKDLPLNEQQRRYHFYLEEVSRQLYIQNKGPRGGEQPTFFLLLENQDYLLQENNYKIIL